MRDSIVNTVHSILRHGLSLRDRLDAAEPLQPENERASLVEMLAPLQTEEIWDADDEEIFGAEISEQANQEVRSRLTQATIRYALTCWLDELLIRHSAWGETWQAFALEPVLYGGATLGTKFWEEARYVESRGDRDALEVIYWCVMLGFRGNRGESPESVEAWAKRVRNLLDQSSVEPVESAQIDWELRIPAGLPASERPFQRMLFSAMMTCSLLIPVALWAYWRH